MQINNDIEIECYNNSQWLKIYEKENAHRNYWQELLSSMTNSDIMEFILDKKKELSILPKIHEWYQLEIDTRKTQINSLLNRFNFELRQRDPDTKTENTKEFLDQKKREISIVQVIQSLTWKHINQSLSRNIKCFLPWHNDKTWSLHIYQHTNTFRCFGCQRWGSQIDLIREVNQCSIWEAIRIFLSM